METVVELTGSDSGSAGLAGRLDDLDLSSESAEDVIGCLPPELWDNALRFIDYKSRVAFLGACHSANECMRTWSLEDAIASLSSTIGGGREYSEDFVWHLEYILKRIRICPKSVVPYHLYELLRHCFGLESHLRCLRDVLITPHFDEKVWQSTFLELKKDAVEVLDVTLWFACYHGLPSHVQVLLDMQIEDLTVKDEYNAYMYLAAEHGHLDILKLFTKHYLSGEVAFRNLDLAFGDNIMLVSACSHGHIGIVRYLFELVENDAEHFGNIDPSARYNMPLLSAAEENHDELIRFFIEKLKSGRPEYERIKRAIDNHRLLVELARVGNLGVLTLLLDGLEEGHWAFAGIKPASHNNKLLIEAGNHGHVKVVELLLDRMESGLAIYSEIDPAARDNTLLMGAARDGYLQIVEMLSERRESGHPAYRKVDFKSLSDLDALLLAVANEKVAIVKLILAKYQKFPHVYGSISAITLSLAHCMSLNTKNGEILRLLKEFQAAMQ